MFYIDEEYKCHASNPDGAYRKIETPLFKGKCSTFIEGYRYIPFGETWTCSDGEIFEGEMLAPWKNYNELDAAQRVYEKQLLVEYEKALSEIEAALEVK